MNKRKESLAAGEQLLAAYHSGMALRWLLRAVDLGDRRNLHMITERQQNAAYFAREAREMLLALVTEH